MKDNSLEERGRLLLRESARQIRKSETTKLRRVTAGSMAMALAAFQVVPAFATIDNTVTASGKSPIGATITANGGASVSVVLAAPSVSIVKTITFAPGGDVNSNGKTDVGDTLA